MIPSPSWFPQSLQTRAAWYQNFYTQIAIVGASLGFSAAEIDGFGDDNTVMQFLADGDTQLNAFGSAVRQYRKIITEGDIGEPTPAFPANPAFALTTTIVTGLFERLNKARARIMAAPTYTDETGALLGILPGTSGSISPDSVKPTITVSPAQTGYLFSVVVANRAESDMWEVWILRKGSANWSNAKTATGKSVDVTVTPTTPGDAEQMQVRVQLRKNNQNYGQPSDVVYVTVNP